MFRKIRITIFTAFASFCLFLIAFSVYTNLTNQPIQLAETSQVSSSQQPSQSSSQVSSSQQPSQSSYQVSSSQQPAGAQNEANDANRVEKYKIVLARYKILLQYPNDKQGYYNELVNDGYNPDVVTLVLNNEWKESVTK